MNQLKVLFLLRLVLVPVTSAVSPDQSKNDTLDISSLLHTFQVRRFFFHQHKSVTLFDT